MKEKKKFWIVFDLLVLIILIIADQLTKHFAVLYLKNQPSYEIIPGILELKYLENQGAAFGMLKNQKAFFIFVAIVILAMICFVILKMPEEKKFNLLHVLLILIAAGAIGNMIDRIRLNYVVDFIYAVVINFPIFNVADIYVTVSTFLLIISFLFYYKEEDLAFLTFRAQKFRKID